MEANNVKAMHDALVEIERLTNSLDKECAVDPIEIRDIARAALKEQPCNCDVGTAEEQDERYRDFCQRFVGGTCTGCELQERGISECAIAWAQLPYESEAKK